MSMMKAGFGLDERGLLPLLPKLMESGTPLNIPLSSNCGELDNKSAFSVIASLGFLSYLVNHHSQKLL
jgi:hypothetical protein